MKMKGEKSTMWVACIHTEICMIHAMILVRFAEKVLVLIFIDLARIQDMNCARIGKKNLADYLPDLARILQAS